MRQTADAGRRSAQEELFCGKQKDGWKPSGNLDVLQGSVCIDMQGGYFSSQPVTSLS